MNLMSRMVAISLVAIPSLHATVTPLAYYRLGEIEAGTLANNQPVSVASDSQGGKGLYPVGSPLYSTNISTCARVHTGTGLAVGFNGNGQLLTNSILTTATNNFGMEAWVNLNTLTGNQAVAYNGDTSISGWGLYLIGGTLQGLYGGVTLFGSGLLSTGVWTHVALVRDSGTATLYINGVAAGASAAARQCPGGGFAIGGRGQGVPGENMNGLIDEVRVFTCR